MPHLRCAVCRILVLCSYPWANVVALKAEVLPLKPDDVVPKIQPQIDAVGASQASFLYRSALHSDLFQTEEDHMTSSHSSVSMVTSPAAPGGITNIDLALLGAGARTSMNAFETQHTRLAVVWWLTIVIFATPVGCAVLFATISFLRQGDDNTLKGKVVDGEQTVTNRFSPSQASVPVVRTASTSPPAPQTFQPAPSLAEAFLRGNSGTDTTLASGPGRSPGVSFPLSFSQTIQPTLSPARQTVQPKSAPAEMLLRGNYGTDATSASGPRISPRGLSPRSFSRAVWTSSVIPPPLCADVVPLQTMASFWVSMESLLQLYRGSAIDITGPFDYPMLRARISRGFGGSRLEVASDPFFHKISGTVGPMDYPGNLSPEALLHGPNHELYGPFLRFGPGFAVGHFSLVDNVLIVAPKRTSDGIVIEITSNNSDGQQLAWARMVDNRTRYQISVHPGVDTTLMAICILSAFVASQNMIDEIGTTI